MGAGVVKAEGRGRQPSNLSPSYFSPSHPPRTDAAAVLSNQPGMSCESCTAQFNTFKRKKTCCHCGRYFCSSCCQRQWNTIQPVRQCHKCQILASGNFTRSDLMQWKIKDLQVFLNKKNISTNTCTEKYDLVELLVCHFGQETYQPPHTYFRYQLDMESDEGRVHPRISSNGVEDSAEEESQEGGSMHIYTSHSRNNHTSEGLSSSATLITQSWDNSQGSRLPLRSTNDTAQSSSLPCFSPSKPAYINLNTIDNIEAVANLTVKELKEILSFHFVDYKGCVEKWELLDRVRRLWEAQRQQKKDPDSPVLNDDEMCKICMDSPIDCVLLECGHMVSCTQCGRKLNECPICRQYVVRAVHIFKA
ncbi:E3 ubiquitin-protein ligase RNF34 [Octopus bimaculoides]|uniref:RING-type domain-containing protein n=1 Tax=Octopus bimaculoides TaxID=37653 RepID=A0A0L8GLZ3_OCTBM|nr:E3 ubiquitin-protein ligase RNF34 [Octopus bimaculoides]XP_052824540.1 E3 ubiquitin-protein ligase RNF34 [Octopus bimaculoides]XP_052824541.1 E3 ubiquitin-protein ligase RNF34 [Octopus bimaculoides]XP_052824542.1 E3 ubiquitin-protein ligase RNF34 [Octopus bimaculoides]XP_052824543.1 E3 ubiquitin-protein ligase RNF34 [Octopus bimaculoides]|eukprot:XP_014779896.1 PREDICTED: E3 ubiquitin-protein ligase RNF34-like [Octopus bimaculoides]